MNTITRVFIIAIAIVVSFGGTSWAWMNDWFDQAVVTRPSSFKGQQRNYFTGGGYSVRWKSATDHPISITSPRLNSMGCGGIDLFMGSMSFAISPEYLVNKLQNIASGASIIALQVGLKTLNEPLATSIENVEHMLDQLNQLQFDDCSTAKTIVAASAESLTGNTEGAKEKLTSWSQETGLHDVWKAGKEAWNNMTSRQAAETSGARAAWLSKAGAGARVLANTDSVLEETMTQMGINDGELLRIARGLVGDIQTDTNFMTAPVVIEGCAENLSGNGIVGALINGEMYVRNNAGVCEQINTNITINGRNYPSLKNWVATSFDNLVDEINDPAGVINGDLEYFINAVSMPVYSTAKTYLMMFKDRNDARAALGSLENLAAESYAIQMLDNMVGVIETIYTHAESTLANQSADEVAEYLSKIRIAVNDKKNDLRACKKYLHDTHMLSMKKELLSLQYAQMQQDLYNEVINEVARRYGGTRGI